MNQTKIYYYTSLLRTNGVSWFKYIPLFEILGDATKLYYEKRCKKTRKSLRIPTTQMLVDINCNKQGSGTLWKNLTPDAKTNNEVFYKENQEVCLNTFLINCEAIIKRHLEPMEVFNAPPIKKLRTINKRKASYVS